MPRYTTNKIKIDELYLDEKNPRFIIPPNPSQQSIVDYLIENEEVEKLAEDIAQSGGLYAGERIIVTKENDRWIVLEGNRRICACKILMDPQLLANRRLASINKISLLMNEELKQNLTFISADVMNNRLEAQSSLAAKHIDGIKKWSTISKQKFFALEFDSGKSIQEISIITGVSLARIKTGLKEYRIIEYVLKLPFWTDTERENYLNLQQIKTTRLTRLFNAKTSNLKNKRLREIIDLDYDDNYQIITSLDKKIFDKIMYIVASAAFIPDYASEFNGTRSTYEDIPQLMQFLEEKGINPTDNIDLKKKVNISSRKEEKKNKDIINNNRKEKKVVDNKQFTSKRDVLIPGNFKVNCDVVKINDIINELKQLKFNKCINAQAVLLRVLLELSLKFYLNQVGEDDKIKEGHLDGTYTAVLEYMRNKKILKSAEHSNLVQLRKNSRIFNIFNGYVHYDSVVPNKDDLIFYFDNLRRIIEICLNS